MTDNQPMPSEIPPHARLIQMGRARYVVRREPSATAAAKLGLADGLAAGPKSAAHLAVVYARTCPFIAEGFMRALASLGILTQRPEQRFALTEFGRSAEDRARLARHDHP